MTEYYNPGTAFNGRSSRFGRRTHPITGVATGHAGDDWRAPAETAIPAAANGKVIRKRYNYNGRTGYGNYIVLEHFDNNTNQIVHTLYAHMIRQSTLTVGAVVSKGDTVGNVGSTGGSTGNHLHFEVRTGGTAGSPLSGTPVDPDTYDISELVAPDGASPTTASNTKSASTNGFRFPVAPGEGKEFTAEELYGKLSQENTGYYLLSANRFWHGGVHFTSQNFSAEMPVQAVADGTVIAYRINNSYLETPTSPFYEACKYSSGFCLIKHTIPFTREKTAEEKQQEIQQKVNQTATQLNNQQITVQGKSSRAYRDSEGITNIPRAGFYPVGAKLQIISVGNELKDDYYFAKVQQVKEQNTTNAIEGEHYIALLDKEGNPIKNSDGKAFFEMPANATETPNNQETSPSSEPIAGTTPNATESTETDNKESKAETTNTPPPLPLKFNLEFYSLYMHLSAYEDYLPPKEDDTKKEEEPKQITIKAQGLRVRDKHRDEADAKVIGKISNGAKLEIIETKVSGQFTDVKAKLLTGSVTNNAVKIGETLWVPIKDGTKSYYTEDTEKTTVPKEKTRPSYWEGKVTAIVKSASGLTIWEKFEDDILKTKLGDINQGSQFTFNSTEVKTIVHEMKSTLIAECTAIGNFSFRANGEQPKGTFWTTVDKASITRTKVEPLVFDTVVPCNTDIIAGEPLGYLGTYEAPTKDGEISTKKQVHVEIFTPNLAAVEFLLNNPFKLTGRKYIKVPKGTLLKGEVPIKSDVKLGDTTEKAPTFPGLPSEPREQDYGFGAGTILGNTTSSTLAPQTNKPAVNQASTAPTAPTTTQPAATTTTVGSQTQPAPTQEVIPDYTTTKDHYFAVDKLTTVNDKRIINKGKDIEIVAGDETYYQIAVEKHTGYLNKKGIEEIDQHEWAKLGFQLVEETNTNSDGYLNPKLMPAVFQQIYNKIDTNKDGKLQPEELKAALQDEEIRDQWSKLIAYHPSEWKLDTRPLLARFTQLLSNSLAPADKLAQAQALLVNETQKVNTLTFLEQIVPPISPTPMLYHFHPVAFVDYMAKGRRHPIIYIDGKAIELEFLYFYDGSKIEESDYIDAATKLGCEVAAIKAVAKTETGSSGSYFSFPKDDQVPAILFERHHFHRYTAGAYSAANPDISNSVPGGYGGIKGQYKKLLKAYNLNKSAALKSASWGMFQILGSNHLAAGYSTTEEFVFDISRSEKNHLKAFVNFIKADSRLSSSIVSKDWTKFAKAYNGAKQVGYDKKMEAHYNALTAKK